MKQTKVFWLVIAILIFILLGLIIRHQSVHLTVLGDLKLDRLSDNRYQLNYHGEDIGAVLTAVDTWYVHKPFVAGSTTDVTSGKGDLVYFVINVCNGQNFESRSYNKFLNYLDDIDFPQYKRNWMSGDNFMEVLEPGYSSDIDCTRKDFKPDEPALPLLGDLNLNPISYQTYTLLYQGEQIGGILGPTPTHRLYIDKPYVATTTYDTNPKLHLQDTAIYLVINVCTGEKLETKDNSVYEQYLQNIHFEQEPQNRRKRKTSSDLREITEHSGINCDAYYATS